MDSFNQENFSVSHSRRINAPKAAVWKAFASSRALEVSHPFVASQTDMVGAGAKGATDEITYNSGLLMRRKFVNWYEGEGFDLELISPTDDAAYVSWRVTPHGDTGSVLTVVFTPPHVREDMSEEARAFIHGLRLKPAVELYLANMLRGIHHHVETGKRTERNQWGAHPWFSP
jgi:hypothetical protein